MWYDQPITQRAPSGGFVDPLNGRFYKGGEITPFYVPRPVMPQVDEADYLELMEFVADQGIALTVKKASPLTLVPHQRIDPIKAAEMPPEVRRKPILVSRDGYVLDGNHRWLAHSQDKSAITVFEVALDFEAAVKLLFEFPKCYDLADRPQAN